MLSLVHTGYMEMSTALMSRLNRNGKHGMWKVSTLKTRDTGWFYDKSLYSSVRHSAYLVTTGVDYDINYEVKNEEDENTR